MSNKNPIAKIAEMLPDAPVPPMIGVGAIALQMAMSYHDSTVIKDGVLYQQMKIECRNIGVLELEEEWESSISIVLDPDKRPEGWKEGFSEVYRKTLNENPTWSDEEKKLAVLDTFYQYENILEEHESRFLSYLDGRYVEFMKCLFDLVRD